MSDRTTPDELSFDHLAILGERLSGQQPFIGRGLLFELFRHAAPDGADESPEVRAAFAEEDFFLENLRALPALTFRDVEVKLALALRYAEWSSLPANGSYGAAAAGLLASSLADVILLRTAELARLGGDGTAQEKAERERATIRDILAEIRATRGLVDALRQERKAAPAGG